MSPRSAKTSRIFRQLNTDTDGEDILVKFLCLAYGKAEDWHALPEARRQELLRRDDALRQRDALISVVGEPTVVRAWDGAVHRSSEAFAASDSPLVGFSIIEATDLDEAVELVSGTPCAVARGAIEVRPLVVPVD